MKGDALEMPKKRNRSGVVTCHPNRPYYSNGLCRRCYENERYAASVAGVERRGWRQKPTCHPMRKYWGKGLCRTCYKKSDYAKNQSLKRAAFRRWQFGMTAEDERRFQTIVNCDWCGFPFLNGERPQIDHDHLCCPGSTKKHCRKCMRGFVHTACNVRAISYYEWLEKTFGVTDPKLA